VICFNRLWETMKRKNISTYYLREKSGIDSKTVRRLKNNENIETKTLDKLCRALDCDITDILEYVKE
jgi:putative transcriptional regulator